MGPFVYYGTISSPVLALAFFGMIIAGVAAGPAVSPTTAPQAAYQPQEVTAAASNYVPHSTYPYDDRYGVGAVSPYDSYYPTYPFGSGYMSALVPAAQGALSMALTVFSKVGLFLFGGIALFIVGGIFTTAVCSLTPLCTISFNGLGNLDKDTMRAYMSPDKISAAAALVQDAIGKYNTMNRNTRN